MINVSSRELKRAFHHLRSSCADELLRRDGPRTAASLLLLGLYAAECGLKWLLLQQRGVHFTDCLAKDDAVFFSHDLNGFLTHLGQPPRFRATTGPSPDRQVQPSQLHQLYRYGGLLTPADERQLIDSLLQVFAYIEENAP